MPGTQALTAGELARKCRRNARGIFSEIAAAPAAPELHGNGSQAANKLPPKMRANDAGDVGLKLIEITAALCATRSIGKVSSRQDAS